MGKLLEFKPQEKSKSQEIAEANARTLPLIKDAAEEELAKLATLLSDPCMFCDEDE